VKLIRIAATAITVALISAAVGRWLFDPCGGDAAGWLVFLILVFAPAIAAWMFSLPTPSMPRYMGNSAIACFASVFGLAVGVDDSW